MTRAAVRFELLVRQGNPLAERFLAAGREATPPPT